MSQTTSKPFAVFASELAAWLRSNPYTSYEQAVLKAWQRNHIRSYEAACKRNSFINPTEEVQQKLTGTRVLEKARNTKTLDQAKLVQNEVKQIVTLAELSQRVIQSPKTVVSSIAESGDPNANTLLQAEKESTERTVKLNASKARLVLKSKTQPLTSTESEMLSTLRSSLDQEAKVAQNITFQVKTFATELVLDQASSSGTELADKAAMHLRRLRTNEKEIRMLKESLEKAETNAEKEYFEQQRKEAELQKSLEVAKAESFVSNTAQKALTPIATKNLKDLPIVTYGKNAEAEYVRHNKVTNGNERLYKLNIGTTVTVYGRVDGFRDGKLVEIKHRRNRLYDMVPYYEKVQLWTYMEMLKLDEATLVQVFNGKTSNLRLQRDPTWWDSKVVPAMDQAYMDFQQLLNDSRKQDDLMKSFQASLGA